MGDRECLVAACGKSPVEDFPRLAYADWLVEHGVGDRDAATVEFIRVSCGHPSRAKAVRVMPKAAYAWLRRNWARLVPTLCGRMRCRGEFSGRNWVGLVRESTPLAETFAGTTVHNPQRRLILEFYKGFLIGYTLYTQAGNRLIPPLLAEDQPLAKNYLGKTFERVWPDDEYDVGPSRRGEQMHLHGESSHREYLRSLRAGSSLPDSAPPGSDDDA